MPTMTIDDRRLQRIRWRCRRGMLENDLILNRFLDVSGNMLTEDDIASLDTLLDMPDNALWELIGGAAEPDDAALMPLVARLRAL
jgi:antitoxin CptB